MSENAPSYLPANSGKFCVDCRHHVAVAEPEKGVSRHQCQADAARCLVTGAAASCNLVRHDSGACGRVGHLFAPIEPA